MDTESGSGDLPRILVEQPGLAMDATDATVDDLNKLESSILDRMEAMLSKYLGKQDNSQTSCTTLHCSQDRSIVDLMISYICSSTMECQLSDSLLHTRGECSIDDEEECSPSQSPSVTSVVISETSTTSSLFDVVPDTNPNMNSMCFMAKSIKVSSFTKATSLDDFLAKMQGGD